MVPVADLKPFERNARTHPQDQIDTLARVIADSGFTAPLIIDASFEIIAGHGRLMAAQQLGMAEVPCVRVEGLTPEQVRALRLSDNQLTLRSGWDHDLLNAELLDLKTLGFDLALTGFDVGDDFAGLGDIGAGLPDGSSGGGAGGLAERFGIPPFTVLNAREGWWQDRKRAWIGLGIKSELGRGEGATYQGSEQIGEPGLNHYRNKEKGRAYHDGAIKGQGGLADQVAAAATARTRRKANAATGGSAEPLARLRAGKQSVMKGKPGKGKR